MRRLRQLFVVGCFAVLPHFAFSAPAAAAEPLRIVAMDSVPVSFDNHGRADGYAVELARQVQQLTGGHEAISIVPWARADTLVMGTPNVVALSMVYTEERGKSVRFVGPILTAYISAFAVKGRADQLRHQGDAMRQLRSGARRGSIHGKLAKQAGYNVSDEVNSSETAARMLMAGRFDLLFDGDEIVGGALTKAGYKPSDVEVVFRLGTRPVYFAFSAGTPDATVQAWDAALRELKRNGSFQKTHDKWLHDYPLLPEARK